MNTPIHTLFRTYTHTHTHWEPLALQILSTPIPTYTPTRRRSQSAVLHSSTLTNPNSTTTITTTRPATLTGSVASSCPLATTPRSAVAHLPLTTYLNPAQLENNFASYWPPSMGFQQWMLFCKETETSDPRSNSRISAMTQPHKVIHPRDCEQVFRAYAKLDPNAINTAAPVLTYEGFLSAIIDLSYRVKRFDNPYLSEAVREFILSYVSRASKMSPTGLRRGQMRDALEGTKEGPPPTPGGTHLAPTVKSLQRSTVATAVAASSSKKKVATISSSVQEYPLVRTLTGLVRTTTGTSAGGSLAASRPSSALSRRGSLLPHTALEQDLHLEQQASSNRIVIT